MRRSRCRQGMSHGLFSSQNCEICGTFKTFQEPQEPGSKCSCNHPAEMIWDLLCLGCGEDRKAYPFFKLLDLNLQDKLVYRFHMYSKLGLGSMVGVVILATHKIQKKHHRLILDCLEVWPCSLPKFRFILNHIWTFRNCWHGQFSQIQSPCCSVPRNHVQCIAEPLSPNELDICRDQKCRQRRRILQVHTDLAKLGALTGYRGLGMSQLPWHVSVKTLSPAIEIGIVSSLRIALFFRFWRKSLVLTGNTMPTFAFNGLMVEALIST